MKQLFNIKKISKKEKVAKKKTKLNSKSAKQKNPPLLGFYLSHKLIIITAPNIILLKKIFITREIIKTKMLDTLIFIPQDIFVKKTINF